MKGWTRLELWQTLKNYQDFKHKAWLRDRGERSKAKPKPVPARAPAARPRTCWHPVRSRGSPKRPRRPGRGLPGSLAFARRFVPDSIWSPGFSRLFEAHPAAGAPEIQTRYERRSRTGRLGERRGQHGRTFPLPGSSPSGRCLASEQPTCSSTPGPRLSGCLPRAHKRDQSRGS